jgi:hypothetical protein
MGLGQFHTCAYTTEGLFCWGYNNFGQIGLEPKNEAIIQPTKITFFDNKHVTKIVNSQSDNNCVLADGDVYCWGQNSRGSLGNGTTTDSYTPVKVTNLNAKVVDIDMQGNSVCANVSGSVKCWGSNAYDFAESFDQIFLITPGDVPTLSSKALYVSVSSTNACVMIDSTIKCWGEREFGILGDGVRIPGNATEPIEITGL